MAFTSQPLNNLKYTEHLTEMRQRWLTDTSISPAICLSEGGKQMGPSCMKKRALLISERRQRESEKEGWEIASSQFRFDEGHSVFSGWAVIYIMAKTSEATVKMCPDVQQSVQDILQWLREGYWFLDLWQNVKPVWLVAYIKVFTILYHCITIVLQGRGSENESHVRFVPTFAYQSISYMLFLQTCLCFLVL